MELGVCVILCSLAKHAAFPCFLAPVPLDQTNHPDLPTLLSLEPVLLGPGARRCGDSQCGQGNVAWLGALSLGACANRPRGKKKVSFQPFLFGKTERDTSQLYSAWGTARQHFFFQLRELRDSHCNPEQLLWVAEITLDTHCKTVQSLWHAGEGRTSEGVGPPNTMGQPMRGGLCFTKEQPMRSPLCFTMGQPMRSGFPNSMGQPMREGPSQHNGTANEESPLLHNGTANEESPLLHNGTANEGGALPTQWDSQ